MFYLFSLVIKTFEEALLKRHAQSELKCKRNAYRKYRAANILFYSKTGNCKRYYSIT